MVSKDKIKIRDMKLFEKLEQPRYVTRRHNKLGRESMYNMLVMAFWAILVEQLPRPFKWAMGPLIFRATIFGGQLASTIGTLASSRVVEYSWVMKNLDASGKRILEVGCALSYLSHELIRLGYDAYGVDFNPYPQRNPQLKFFQQDAKKTNFPDNFFNQIIAVSTIEHLGIGGFGDPVYRDGDLQWMKEAKRILRPGGKMLLTFPYGDKHAVDQQRVYDDCRIDEICRGLWIEKEEYYVISRTRWLRVPKKKARNLGVAALATACLMLRKPCVSSENPEERKDLIL